MGKSTEAEMHERDILDQFVHRGVYFRTFEKAKRSDYLSQLSF